MILLPPIIYIGEKSGDQKVIESILQGDTINKNITYSSSDKTQGKHIIMQNGVFCKFLWKFSKTHPGGPCGSILMIDSPFFLGWSQDQSSIKIVFQLQSWCSPQCESLKKSFVCVECWVLNQERSKKSAGSSRHHGITIKISTSIAWAIYRRQNVVTLNLLHKNSTCVKNFASRRNHNKMVYATLQLGHLTVGSDSGG